MLPRAQLQPGTVGRAGDTGGPAGAQVLLPGCPAELSVALVLWPVCQLLPGTGEARLMPAAKCWCEKRKLWLGTSLAQQVLAGGLGAALFGSCDVFVDYCPKTHSTLCSQRSVRAVGFRSLLSQRAAGWGHRLCDSRAPATPVLLELL